MANSQLLDPSHGDGAGHIEINKNFVQLFIEANAKSLEFLSLQSQEVHKVKVFHALKLASKLIQQSESYN